LEKIKQPGPVGLGGGSPPLDATPLSIDFGRTNVGSETARMIVFVNPFGFSVTVVQLSVEGDAFFIPNNAAPVVIPPKGQLAVTAAFRPTDQRGYSRRVLVEIDSAVKRFTQVLTAEAFGRDGQCADARPLANRSELME
jgi:hypothetical protein